jgi:hypothetical protein
VRRGFLQAHTGPVKDQQRDDRGSELSRAASGPALQWSDDNNTDDEIAAAGRPDRRMPNPGAVFSLGISLTPH